MNLIGLLKLQLEVDFIIPLNLTNRIYGLTLIFKSMVAKIDIPGGQLTIGDFGNKHTIWGSGKLL